MKNIFIGYLLGTFLLIACKTTHIERDIGSDSPFTDVERQLIRSAPLNQPMRVYKINNYQDSLLLRTPSQEVTIEENTREEIAYFSKRLLRTVQDSMSLGVGIAAPQVGVLQRMIWVQRFDKEEFPFEFFINPKIRQYSTKKQQCREGCLSIPNRSDTLNSRAYAILIEYDKLDGTHHVEMVEDFTAVIFQHEIDHLDGILYTDHLAADIEATKRTENKK